MKAFVLRRLAALVLAAGLTLVSTSAVLAAPQYPVAVAAHGTSTLTGTGATACHGPSGGRQTLGVGTGSLIPCVGQVQPESIWGDLLGGAVMFGGALAFPLNPVAGAAIYLGGAYMVYNSARP